MRTILILILFLMNLGCSNTNNSKDLSKANTQTSDSDTLRTETKVLNENCTYIGFINNFYFSKNKEGYIELYFKKDETNDEDYQKIVKLADSLIYQDDENSRYKFPSRLSASYFDLRGLSKLKLYNKDNNQVANAEFLRVEFLEQNISSPFIAVYKTDKKINDDSYYGISNFNGIFESEKYTLSKNTVLTQNILIKLKEKRAYGELAKNGTHVYFSNSDTVLSIINSEDYAYVVLTSNTSFSVVYKSEDFENIFDLRIIPLTKNKLPYILTRNVKPETDVFYDKLLLYNGTNYTPANRQRVE